MSRSQPRLRPAPPSAFDAEWNETPGQAARSTHDRGVLATGLIAAVALGVGALLPWATWSGFSDATTAGISAAGSATAVGIATLGAGIAVAVGSMLRYATRRFWPAALAVAGGVAGLGLAGDALFNSKRVFADFATSRGLSSQGAGIGVGLPSVLGGAALAAFVYLWDLSRNEEAQARQP